MNDNRFNLVEMIKIWLRWKKHIFIVCIVATVGSAVVALLMPEYFKSTAVFFPYNPKLSDPRTLYVKDMDYNIFGKNEDLDRIISIANSSVIHRDMIKEFSLLAHYNIDEGEKAMAYALDEFKSNFSFIRNDEGALELTMYDTDKDLAAEMVKTMVGKINYINIQTIKENNEKLLQVYKNHALEKEKEVVKLTDSLNTLRNKHQLFVPISKANISDINSLKTNKNVDEILALETRLDLVNKEFIAARENYTQTQSTLDNFTQSLFIVEEAIPAELKSKPVRWFIVLSSFLIALFLSTLYAVIIDFYRTDVKHLLS